MINRFVRWLTAQIGSIYVWGAQGEIASEAFIRSHETSETDTNRALKLYNTRKSEGKSPIRAYDCSGLIVKFFLDNELIDNDVTSAGLHNLSKAISRDALSAGNLVFRHNGTRVYHVGVYIGDSMIIHAKGRDVGVIVEHINANGSDYWNRFGEYEKLTEGKVTEMKVLRIESPLMRGNDIEKLQAALNGLGYNCGTADGICGKQTMAGIESFCRAHASKTESEQKAAVTVKIGNTLYSGNIGKL